jgi:hypothetical protein
MEKETPQPEASDLPPEVLEIIGTENMHIDDPLKHSVMVATLEKVYKQHGIEYIRKHRDRLIEQSKILDMF